MEKTAALRSGVDGAAAPVLPGLGEDHLQKQRGTAGRMGVVASSRSSWSGQNARAEAGVLRQASVLHGVLNPLRTKFEEKA